MVIYAPGTEETDPKKQNMALQQVASAATTAIADIATNTADISTNTANIATNTTNIATNTANIATNTADIAALQAAQFPSGTLMLFQQTSAPTGWTKQTTHNDKALRVVSGAASSGGSNSFSTVMAQTVVGSTTLTTSQIPSHTHGVPGDASTVAGSGVNRLLVGSSDTIAPVTITSGSAGSGGSHDHTITMNMQYVDLIIASKN